MGGYVPPHLRAGGGGGERGGGRRGGPTTRTTTTRHHHDAGVAPSAAVADALRTKDATEKRLSKDGAAYAATACDAFERVARVLEEDVARADADADADREISGHRNKKRARDARLALAETLRASASARALASRRGALSPELRRAESEAAVIAAAAYARSTETFAQLCAATERDATDAATDDAKDARETMVVAVNGLACALAAWGDLLAAEDPSGAEILARACAAYERALELERDAGAAGGGTAGGGGGDPGEVLEACWNLADARVKLGEARAAIEDARDASSNSTIDVLLRDETVARKRIDDVFASASAAFEDATSLADAAAGDDLGGLLHDWGCGLLSRADSLAAGAMRVAKKITDVGGALPTLCVELATAAHGVLDAAEEKLRTSASFTPGAIAVCNTLGETYQSRAELIRHTGVLPGNAGGGVVVAGPTIRERRTHAEGPLLTALDARGGGFGAAAALSSSDRDALTGAGEAHLELGRIAKACGDDGAAAARFADAWGCYRRVLEMAAADGGGGGGGGDEGVKSSERLGVCYNGACAAYLAGDVHTAGMLLSQVLTCGGTTPEGISSDEDLAGMPAAAWGG